VVSAVKVLEGAELVPAVRVNGPRVIDELGDHVDSGRIGAERAEVVGEVPGTAPQIEHRATPASQVPLDECEVIGVHPLAGTKQLDVEIRDGRI
jgi:hypothetical protein